MGYQFFCNDLNYCYSSFLLKFSDKFESRTLTKKERKQIEHDDRYHWYSQLKAFHNPEDDGPYGRII